jgi:hypothetical protein
VQAFGLLTYSLSSTTDLNFMFSASPSTNQLPNVPGLAPAYTLANAPVEASADINSYINFQDYLAIVSLSSTPSEQLSFHLSYTAHEIDEIYLPDDVGELEYQGVATQASHKDMDNILQGDMKYVAGPNTISTGFYLGGYHVTSDGSSLVFPADSMGNQISDVPVDLINQIHQENILTGLYVDDCGRSIPS